MITATDEVLDQAIAIHAVLLNRAMWLSPDRLDLQRTVWSRLIAAYPGNGLLTVGDVEAATVRLIGETDAREILPSVIVDAAGKRANARYHEAVEIVLRFEAVGDDFVAADEAWCAKLQLPLKEKSEMIEGRFDAIRLTLVNSGLPQERIRPVLTVLGKRSAWAASAKALTQPTT